MMKYLCYDGALNEAYTLVQLMKKYPQNMSLFKGTDDEGIWESAPWLFEVNDNFYDMQDQPLMQLNRCIVFETAESIKEVCDYLHTKMYLKTNDQLSYFRIWDANVLIDFLNNTSEVDRESFFQIFQSFYTEKDNNNLLQWTNTSQGIIATIVSKKDALPIGIKQEIDVQEAQQLEQGKAEFVNSEKIEKEQLQQTDTPKKRKFFLD